MEDELDPLDDELELLPDDDDEELLDFDDELDELPLELRFFCFRLEWDFLDRETDLDAEEFLYFLCLAYFGDLFLLLTYMEMTSFD